MSYVDTAMDSVDHALTSPKDHTPDYRQMFQKTIIFQFTISLLLSIWLPDITGSVVVFGYVALSSGNVEALLLYLLFDFAALLVTLVRLSWYSHQLSHGGRAAEAAIIFFSVIAMCLQVVGFFFAHRLKVVFERDDGQGYKSLSESAAQYNDPPKRNHQFQFNTTEDVQVPVSSGVTASHTNHKYAPPVNQSSAQSSPEISPCDVATLEVPHNVA
eukprot:CAMPEP_0196587054 /NCGR_PEP_ID=MMETSP1081-20130531/56302_1 /TAXON_ID=36882 /ORGANISM="Pyramimonas amylifera, Strain CCMP720" /LENGTH=214 /DNA_ID=CAMNT_0041909129 /DNA_START=151 /DNA_END=795 /DNA_ORIENTATION=-